MVIHKHNEYVIEFDGTLINVLYVKRLEALVYGMNHVRTKSNKHCPTETLCQNTSHSAQLSCEYYVSICHYFFVSDVHDS